MRRLYLRIYIAVLASIVLSVALAGVAWRTFGDGERFFQRTEFFAEAALSMLPPADAPVEEQRRALEKWERLSGMTLALLDRDRGLIGGSPELAARAHRNRRIGSWRHWTIALADGRVLTGARQGPGGLSGVVAGGPPGLLLILTLVAFSVAIAAWPVVRRLTRNLEALEASVAAFGSGDLSRRVAVSGRDEAARLAETFNRTAARIETLVRNNKALMANASHELRSPLARLRMSVEQLAGQAPPQVRAEIVRNIHELDQLVGEILDASRLDGDPAAALRLDTLDMAGLAAEECAQAGASFEAPGQVDAMIAGDARLLRRLLRNLVENARRHGQGTAIEVQLAGTTPDRIVLSVCDRGPGVPEAERERIFEPFYRRVGASEADGGVGLGLALVRQIARAHGGDARYRARKGGGACFEVELPANLRQSGPAPGS